MYTFADEVISHKYCISYGTILPVAEARLCRRSWNQFLNIYIEGSTPLLVNRNGAWCHVSVYVCMCLWSVCEGEGEKGVSASFDVGAISGKRSKLSAQALGDNHSPCNEWRQ